MPGSPHSGAYCPENPRCVFGCHAVFVDELAGQEDFVEELSGLEFLYRRTERPGVCSTDELKRQVSVLFSGTERPPSPSIDKLKGAESSLQTS